MTDFPGIAKQSRGIARLYKFLGLWSIPVLTLVTIISISNVFTHGQLASGSLVQMTWAVIFAAAIEVNIVRLFFESKLDKDRGAFVLGIVLAIVAGAALLIEGLQQSIGFDWANIVVQWTVGIVVGLRVLVVVLLLAREGAKLATVLSEDVPPLYACLVQFDAPKPKLDPIPEPRIESIEEARPRILALPEPKPNGHKEAIRDTIEKFMTEGRSYTYQDIANAIPCSVQTVKVHAPKIKKELSH
jgi:hypothetical protein